MGIHKIRTYGITLKDTQTSSDTEYDVPAEGSS